jgi:flagellar motor switch protein FliG
MNENVMSAILATEKQKELQPIAPLLASLEKNKEAVVSDAFFVQMQASTWKQIQSQSSTTKSMLSEKSNALDRLLDLLFRPSFAMGFAAFCALIFCGTFFLSNNSTQENTTIASAQQLTNSEIQAYIAENNDDFDESLLTKDFGGSTTKAYSKIQR